MRLIIDTSRRTRRAAMAAVCLASGPNRPEAEEQQPTEVMWQQELGQRRSYNWGRPPSEAMR